MSTFNSQEWRKHNESIDIRRVRGGRPSIGSAYQPKPYIQPAIHIVRKTGDDVPFWKKVLWAVLFVGFFVGIQFAFR